MTKVTFEVVPQKSDGRAYIDVELPKATSFAVIRKESFTRNGKRYKTQRVVNRYSKMSEAELEATTQAKRYAPKARDYKLGKRMDG